MSLFQLLFLAMAVIGAAGCALMGEPRTRLLGLLGPAVWGLGSILGGLVFMTGPMHFLATMGVQGIGGFLGVWLFQKARLEKMTRAMDA